MTSMVDFDLHAYMKAHNLSRTQLCAIIGCSRIRIWRWIKSGQTPEPVRNLLVLRAAEVQELHVPSDPEK